MADRNYLTNPTYYTKTARTLSESRRDAQYACSIYEFEEDKSQRFAALVISAVILAGGLLAFYFDEIITHLR